MPIALAATWDLNLVDEVATAISDEARAIYNGWHQDPAFPGEHKGLTVSSLERIANPAWLLQGLDSGRQLRGTGIPGFLAFSGSPLPKMICVCPPVLSRFGSLPGSRCRSVPLP